MNVIFDTNAVYYLESKLSNENFEKMNQMVEKNELTIFISPITVIEMTSRLKTQPNGFKKVQIALKKLMSLNPQFLPDPDQQLREYVSNSKSNKNDYKHWKEIVSSIILAPNVTKLESGFCDSLSNRRVVNIDYLINFRKEYEEYYLSSINQVLEQIITDYNVKIDKGRNTRLPKDKISNFKKYLTSSDWIDQIKIMLVNRTEVQLPNNEVEIQIIFEKIYFLKKSYEDLFLKIFEEGYIPNKKKKNDYNDWHFNVYFNDFNDYIFITSENNVVFKELRSKNRCINFEELIK